MCRYIDLLISQLMSENGTRSFGKVTPCITLRGDLQKASSVYDA